MAHQKPSIKSEAKASHFSKWTKALLIAAILITGFALLTNLRERIAPLPPYIKAQSIEHPERYTKHIRIAGQDMLISMSYFVNTPSEEVEAIDALLTAKLPDFTPVKESFRKMKENKELYKQIDILISDPVQQISMPQRAQSLQKINKATVPSGDRYGLAFFSHPKDKNYSLDEMFIKGTLAKPDAIIMCSNDDPNFRSMCSHYVYDSGINFKINYDKKNLPQWSAVQDGAIDLISKFKDGYSESSKSESGAKE